jgi:DNA-directed RNA polymerase specialized sigma subunit
VTAKDYLSQASEIKMKLKCMAEQLAALRSAAVYVSPTVSDMPKATVPNVHKTEDIIIRLVDMESEMHREYYRYADINDTINSVSNLLQRSVLIKRYITVESWDDIARDLHISTSHIYRLHKDGLAEIEQIMNKVDSK